MKLCTDIHVSHMMCPNDISHFQIFPVMPP